MSDFLFFITLMFSSILISAELQLLDVKHKMNKYINQRPSKFKLIYYFFPLMTVPLSILYLPIMMFYKDGTFLSKLSIISSFPVILLSFNIYVTMWFYTSNNENLFCFLYLCIKSKNIYY